MGQPLRLDSLEKGVGREAGAGGNDSSWNMIQQIDNKLASLATHFLRSVRRAKRHTQKSYSRQLLLAPFLAPSISLFVFTSLSLAAAKSAFCLARSLIMRALILKSKNRWNMQNIRWGI